MKTMFEPLLNGLFKIAACAVMMKDSEGNVLFCKMPRSSIGSSDNAKRQVEKLHEKIRGLSRPIYISTDSDIGGYSLPDGSTLTVGPLSRKSESREVYELRISAINAQLDAFAFAARRLVYERDPSFKSSEVDDLKSKLSEVSEILPQWSEVIPDERPHSSYGYELRSLDAIACGDAQSYLKSFELIRNGQDGTLGYTPLRAAQNLSICGIVLNSRAAVAGGLSVEQAYTIADYLILAIERCKTIKQADFIRVQSGVIFADLVSDLYKVSERKKPQSRLIQEAMNAVRRHIYIQADRLTISQELKVNPDYLDRVLKAELNVTVIQLLRAQRIEEAKRILVQTTSPIGEIASILLFANSSYFAKVFKSVTGLTPQQWRDSKLSYMGSSTL